jgi:hypothetical protein
MILPLVLPLVPQLSYGFSIDAGSRPRTIDGVRKSIIVNYVTKDWKDTYELA